MKTVLRSLFLVLLVFMVVPLVLPSASASFFSWGDKGGIFSWITGRATEGTELVKEEVKCVFIDASSEQKCYTDDGSFACSTATTCVVEVSGEKGKTLRWKSSCGGEVYTTIDGVYEYAEFKCVQAVPVQQETQLTEQKVVYPEPTPAPTTTSVSESIKEQVTCRFLNSQLTQKCYAYTNEGEFTCTGTTECNNFVSGKKGTQVKWASSCGGSAYTILDGSSKYVEFRCVQESTTPTATQVSAPAPKPVETVNIETVKEQDQCIFKNSNSRQECHTGDSRFSCSGIGSCSVEISGQRGAQVTWGSSCGGYAYTLLDGNSENAEFNCAYGTSASTSTRDKVKLYFFYWENCPLCDSEKRLLEQLKLRYPLEYDSYSATPPQSQSYTYFVVSNLKEGMPTIFFDNKIWVGYNDDIAMAIENKIKSCLEEGCSLSPAIPTAALQMATATPIQRTSQVQEIPATPVERAYEKTPEYRFKVYFFWNSGCQACNQATDFIKRMSQKYPTLYVQSTDVNDDDSKKYFSNAVRSLGAEPVGYPTTIIGDRIWVGYSDAIAAEIENKIISCFREGCVAAPMVKEQVECIFRNSDVLINPHTARAEECYSEGNFGCKWTGEVTEKAGGERYAYCIAEVSGVAGTAITWKSSCGGYAYTLIDGNREVAEFKCTPSAEVRQEQIIGKGFRSAYWQCYDGIEQKPATSASVSCKSSETWQKEAREFCQKRCKKDGSKCGVNSFSVLDECYIDVQEPVFIPIIEERIEEKTPQEIKEEVLICKDSCPLNGKCYPFGYRKGGRFCSDEGLFVEQSESDAACDNNFECSSNVCIDGNCISSGLIQRIMNWFRRLAG